MNDRIDLRLGDKRSVSGEVRTAPLFGENDPGAAPRRIATAASPFETFVNRLLLRSPLDDAEIAAIVRLPWQSDRVAAGQELVGFGERTSMTYLVEAGAIGRYSQMRNGARQIVAMHIAGEMADLCAVVLPKSSWAYQALIPSTVLQIAHADLLGLCTQYPAIATAFWRDCTVDMAIMSEWMVSIARRPAESRLAHLICELQSRYQQARLTAPDGSFTFPVTQAQLADILGITSIHVNRMVRSLRERGLASVSKSVVAVHDRPALERLAEFSPDYLHLPFGDSAALHDSRPLAVAGAD
jgi:CRP-like cAMP-binding protein